MVGIGASGLHERMNSPLEGREVRLRGLWPRDLGVATSHEQQRV